MVAFRGRITPDLFGHDLYGVSCFCGVGTSDLEKMMKDDEARKELFHR